MYFLDLKVFPEGGRLCTSLYRKPTSGNSVLHENSCHMRNTVTNIPHGELLRTKRNCTRDCDYQVVARECIDRFRVRGYQEDTLRLAKSRVDSMQRVSLFEEDGSRNQMGSVSKADRFRMITEYSEDTGEIRKAFRRNWHILKSDPIIGEDLPKSPLLMFRRARTLRDVLVQSHCASESRPVPFGDLKGFYPCHRCRACKNSKRVLTYDIPGLDTPRRIMRFMNSNTSHTVYCLVCPCGLRYIGSTIHPTKVRILEHLRAIANRDVTYPVA